MYTPPFGAALENALKETVQGGLLQVCSGRIIQPQFFCCVSGTTVGVDKDPVALIIMQTQVCAGDAICLDYSHSWSPSSTIGRWDVDWGDGNTSNGVWPGAGSVCHPLGGYQFAGVYTVKLTVTDIISAVGSAEVEVNVIYCPQIPLPVYCGCGASGVWFSHNCGAAWENRGGGTLDDKEVYDLKASPFDKAIWVGDAISGYFDTAHIELWCASEIGLHKTLNGGLNWSKIELPEPGVGVGIPTARSITPSIYDRNEWYVLAETATRVYLYRTVDDGETFTWLRLGTKQIGDVWTDVDGFESGTGDIAISEDGMKLYHVHDNRIYLWNGTSWSIYTDKLSDDPGVGDVIVDVVEKNGVVYIISLFNRVYYSPGGGWTEIGRFNDTLIGISIGNSDGLIYICGEFTEDVPYSTDYKSRCARYSGGGWTPLGGNDTIGGKDIGYVVDIAQTASGTVYIACNPSIPGEYDGVAVLSGGAFADAGFARSTPTRLYIHPETDDLYVLRGYMGTGPAGRYYDGSWHDLPGNPGPSWITVMQDITLGVDGFIYICGFINSSPDYGRVWRLDGASWTLLKTWNVFGQQIQSRSMGFMVDGCLYVSNYSSPPTVRGMQRSCPTSAIYNVHLADEGLTHVSSMDASAEYVYIAMLVDDADTPVIIRVDYDLSGFDIIYNPGEGTWGGVRGDYTTLKRVWLFGDFGDPKVLLGNEAGDSLIDTTDDSWGASELVRPILPSIFNSRDLVAVVNDALEMWQTGSEGIVWEKMGDTDFALHCGDRDTIDPQLVLIGRLDSGAEHLDATVDLGRNFFDADGANLTPNAPITAIQIV